MIDFNVINGCFNSGAGRPGRAGGMDFELFKEIVDEIYPNAVYSSSSVFPGSIEFVASWDRLQLRIYYNSDVVNGSKWFIQHYNYVPTHMYVFPINEGLVRWDHMTIDIIMESPKALQSVRDLIRACDGATECMENKLD